MSGFSGRMPLAFKRCWSASKAVGHNRELPQPLTCVECRLTFVTCQYSFFRCKVENHFSPSIVSKVSSILGSGKRSFSLTSFSLLQTVDWWLWWGETAISELQPRAYCSIPGFFRCGPR
jgi:hypothetical protein